MKKQTIHEKAVRLIEGGQVNVDGHRVKMKEVLAGWNICMLCEMDSICREGSEMCNVCRECDDITQHSCYLELVTKDKQQKR